MSDDATATDTPTTAEAEEGHNWIEIIAASMLGIAAILTAYAAFYGAQAGDEALKGYTQSARTTADANGYYSDYGQTYAADQTLYLQYAILREQGDDATAEVIKNDIFSQVLDDATTAWLEMPEDTRPLTPLGMEDIYTSEDLTMSQDLFEQADAQFQDALKIDDQGDNFDLAAVYLAVSLFFAGVAALFKLRRIQILMLGGAGLVMIPGLQAIAKGKGWL
ncbi:MAG: hypothetical protein ABMA25_11300 [Ilumatobacteraceae bacterium]